MRYITRLIPWHNKNNNANSTRAIPRYIKPTGTDIANAAGTKVIVSKPPNGIANIIDPKTVVIMPTVNRLKNLDKACTWHPNSLITFTFIF